jgi:hypothetical protein
VILPLKELQRGWNQDKDMEGTIYIFSCVSCITALVKQETTCSDEKEILDLKNVMATMATQVSLTPSHTHSHFLP